VKQQLVDLSWYDFLQIRSYIQLFGFVKISFLFVCDIIYIKHRHKIMGEHKKFFCHGGGGGDGCDCGVE
jgi:hypothetical protein